MAVEEQHREKVQKARIHVTGMTCTTCAATIEKGLSQTAGVTRAGINFAAEEAEVEYNPAQTDLAKIKHTIEELGYGTAVTKSIFPVGGMTCASCVARVEQALREVPGVISAAVNLASEKATVEYTQAVSYADLRRAVEEAGYELGREVQTLEDVVVSSSREMRMLRNRFIFALILAVIIMILSMTQAFMSWAFAGYVLWALATPVQFWAGLRFYRGMWGALKHRTADMNTLIAVGTSAAYLYSVVGRILPGPVCRRRYPDRHLYFDTSAMIIALILLGRFLESRAKGQTSDAIKKLIGLKPKTAMVMRDGREAVIAVEDVQVGDMVLVHPGERIAGGRHYPQGYSSIDESMITGESIPVEKKAGRRSHRRFHQQDRQLPV